MPQRFPGFVGLPVVPVIEEVDAVEVGLALLPSDLIRGVGALGANPEAVSARVAKRVRRAAGNVGVRRQRQIGQQARLGSGSHAHASARSDSRLVLDPT